MTTLRRQQTIASAVKLDGIGYWSGRDVSIELRPAAANSGIVFVHDDSESPVRIRACVTNRVDTPRRTSIERDGARVEMIEHIMSALAGLQIDNCEVWTNNSELPAGDGSCLNVTEALARTATVQQDELRRTYVIDSKFRVGDDQSSLEVEPNPDGGLVVDYTLDYGIGSVIPKQHCRLAITPDIFLAEIAPARTFVLEEEAKRFQQLGFGQGMTYRDLLVIGPDGPIDNEFRFSDECVRHKILDLVGDLAMVGADVHARITAVRSGHQLNALLAETILATQTSTGPQQATASSGAL